jgi:hypothetical protein
MRASSSSLSEEILLILVSVAFKIELKHDSSGC